MSLKESAATAATSVVATMTVTSNDIEEDSMPNLSKLRISNETIASASEAESMCSASLAATTATVSACIDGEISRNMSISDSPPLGDLNLTSVNNLNGNNGGVGGELGIGLSIMQSSPPPHSYRHSRAYRHFKNPPQPHMCIRTTTETGEELFINVLSWTRIVIPQEPSDPIPLYGGMRVPPGTPRSPPLVFAVMANPEVLKDSGRHSKDPEERRAMVELMCDFVEAMNPGVKLVRNAVILKDRDISGELKDVWNAVQAQRDREREEQMMQQRQQQHYHNITTQQMFPKTLDATNPLSIQQQQFNETDTAPNALADKLTENGTSADTVARATTITAVPLQLDNKISIQKQDRNESSHSNINNGATTLRAASTTDQQASKAISNSAKSVDINQQNGNTLDNSNDHTDAAHKAASTVTSATSAAVAVAAAATTPKNKTNKSEKHTTNNSHCSSTPAAASLKQSTIDNPVQQKHTSTSGDTSSTNHKSTNITTTPTSPTSPTNANTAITSTAAAAANATATNTAAPSPPTTKKDKLSGFLPNGYIFPRFKNNRHKDKEKEKESKSRKYLKS